MIPAEIAPRRRVRLCVSERGHGYCWGRIAAFDGECCTVDMDSGRRLSVPWWELVDAAVPPQERVKALPLMTLILEAPYESAIRTARAR